MAILNLFLRWVDKNTILLNEERYWADSEDYYADPLTNKEIVERFYNKMVGNWKANNLK